MSFIKSSKNAYKQVIKETLDREHFDNEISMARSQLEAIADKSTALSSLLKTKQDGLEAWVQYKINQAKDDITGVHDYMVYTPGLNESLEIKETSISDIHKMKEDGKSSEEIAKELKLNVGLVKKILGEEVKLEEIELKEFTDAMLAALKKEYEPLKGKTITTSQYQQLKNILLKLQDGDLEKLQKQNIPFASTGAGSILRVRKSPVKITSVKVPGLEGMAEEKIPQGYLDYLRTIVYKKVDFYEIPPKHIIQHWRDEPHKDRFTGKIIDYKEETEIKEATNVDFVKIDVPLFIRILEFAREDSNSDLDLHYLTTNLLKMKDKVASMPDYETIVKMPVKEDVAADKMNAKQKLKTLAGIEDVNKNTDTAEIGSIKKEETLPERKITGTVNLVKEDDEFKPHDMWDPKTGEKIHVTSMEKHLELKDKGWTHEEPKKEQVKEVKNCGCGHTPCITYGSQKVDEHIVKVKNGYQLQSKSTGKNLGTYPTKAGAEKRERQVQYFKHNESAWDVSGGYENKPIEDLEQKEPTGKLKDACWTGYVAIGTKMKNGKRVPNCVPKSEAYKGAKKVIENAFKKIKEKK
jgi:hypothetical protein